MVTRVVIDIVSANPIRDDGDGGETTVAAGGEALAEVGTPVGAEVAAEVGAVVGAVVGTVVGADVAIRGGALQKELRPVTTLKEI